MVEEQNFILGSYEISGDGYGKPVIKAADIAKKLKANKLAWIHLNASHEKTLPWLEENASYLDNIIFEALLAKETRPRILEFNEGLLVILRGVNLNENADVADMVSLRIWTDEKRIITAGIRNLKAIEDIKKRLEEGTGPKDSAEFLSMITTRLFQRMEPVIMDLDERTDAVEESIIDNPDNEDRIATIDIRKKAIILRRYIVPQRDIVTYLRTAEVPWLDNLHKRQLQENTDRLTRYIEELETIRERAQIVKEELANALAEKMNRNMYTLSIIAAIFLPLGFLTGLLGINVGGMPGAEDETAFWIVCLLCGLFTFVLLALFRKLKWI